MVCAFCAVFCTLLFEIPKSWINTWMCCLSSKWYFYANPSWWWLCRESRNTPRTKFKRAKTHVHIIIVVVSLHNILFIFFCSCALCTVPWPASWFALVKKFTYFVVFSLHTNKKMLLAKKPQRENTQKNSKVRFVFPVIPFASVSFFHSLLFPLNKWLWMRFSRLIVWPFGFISYSIVVAWQSAFYPVEFSACFEYMFQGSCARDGLLVCVSASRFNKCLDSTVQPTIATRCHDCWYSLCYWYHNCIGRNYSNKTLSDFISTF